MWNKLKVKFLKALRSGKYEQGRIFFEKNNKFCCLGVLCKVAKVPTTPNQQIPTEGNWTFVDSVLPSIKDDFGRPTSMALAQLNDAGNSFEVIADWIEKNL